MRSLFVSLMRLGDLLMMDRVLRTYKLQKGAKIDLLIYKEFEFVKALFPYVDNWLTVDRKKMQEVTKRKDQNILNNYFDLEDLVEQIDGADYQQIVSLSHNHLSHYLLSALDTEGKTVVGSRRESGEILYGSPWIKYLNDIGSFEGVSAFHLIDIYRSALGLNELVDEVEMDLFYNNQREIPDEKFICMQLTSNEAKKTPSIDKWVESIQYFRQLAGDMKILVLAAPNEKETLAVQLESVLENTNTELVACDLKTAKALIHRSKLLVTPDTAIKYLADGSNTPVLELSLGSSQYNQTGSYGSDSLILQARLDCAPCGHRMACPYDSFRCQDIMGADLIGYTMFHYMEHNWIAIDVLATEFEKEVRFFRSETLANSYWFAKQLGEDSLADNLRQILHQSSWQVVLQERDLEDWQRFEMEAENIRKFLINNTITDPNYLKPALEKVEAILLGMELESAELIRSLSGEKRFQSSKQSIGKTLTEVDKWFERNQKLNRGVPAFHQLYQEAIEMSGDNTEDRQRATHGILDNINHMFKIERKLSEIIRVDYMEIL